jgi:hypothetical protein
MQNVLSAYCQTVSTIKVLAARWATHLSNADKNLVSPSGSSALSFASSVYFFWPFHIFHVDKLEIS